MIFSTVLNLRPLTAALVVMTFDLQAWRGQTNQAFAVTTTNDNNTD